MNAIKVALFFDMMNRSMIPYTIDELKGATFRRHFGAKGFCDEIDRYGYYLAAYIPDNSVQQDDFMEGVRTYLDDASVYKFKSPYQDKEVSEKELMYIIKIEN